MFGGSGNSSIMMWVYFGVIIVVMYFLMIRPQRKRTKEEQMMRDNIQIGDEITTIGGIIGRVVTVKEDSLIIESGADRNKIKITRTAVGINNTANEKLAAEREAAKAAQEKERAAKLEAKGKTKKKKEDLEDKY
ncbi:MAG: preprotein translocase subunit YajC [Clostridia bacterium]|nr:preprotein translocase subunit YajC [Clostridia bacterium]